MDFFNDYLQKISYSITTVDIALLIQASDLIKKTNEKGGKIIIAGNGGSAAIASHISVDLTKNAKIRGINFNEADLITCFANDYGYDQWISKAIEFFADGKDLVILISSSGESKNIINAALKSKELGLPVITFSGFASKNKLKSLGTLNFWVDNKGYNIVEMTHHIWLVAIVDRIIGKVEYSV